MDNIKEGDKNKQTKKCTERGGRKKKKDQEQTISPNMVERQEFDYRIFQESR